MIKRKNKFKRLYKKLKNKLKQHKKLLTLITLVFMVFFLIKFFYNLYINNPKNIINKVYFDKEIINNSNYNQLVRFTTIAFSGLNSSKEKIFKYKTPINKIKNNFKYVKDIIIKQISSNEIKINYIFKAPNIIFQYSGNSFLIYDEKNIYKFKNLSGIKLKTKNIVYLPKYINNTKNIFWKNDYKKLLSYLKKIKKYFPKSKIFYLPGGEILEIKTNNIKVWVLLKKDINKQLSKFLLLRNKLKLDKVKFIDLGSLDNSIFIK